jgi:hypothetical protein
LNRQEDKKPPTRIYLFIFETLAHKTNVGPKGDFHDVGLSSIIHLRWLEYVENDTDKERKNVKLTLKEKRKKKRKEGT